MHRLTARRVTLAAGLAVLVLIAVALGALAVRSEGGRPPGGDGGAERPNLVVITTDDQALSTFTRRLMPRTFESLVDEGIRFRQAIAAPPLCCPFRAGLLSGQYNHNNGVTRNRPGYSELLEPELVLPAFLRAAGYRTGFVGKYLNGTADSLGPEPAPGWDSWYAFGGDERYVGAELSVDGESQTLPAGTNATEAFNRAALDFVERETSPGGGGPPFMLWLAHYAPHPSPLGGGPCAGEGTAKASAADLRRIGDATLPHEPSMSERDRSDKPEFVRDRGPLTRSERSAQARAWRCSAASLGPVDRGVGELVDALERAGELEDTVIVFSSDNGINYGQHGLVGKRGVYEPMLRIPMAVRAGRETMAGNRGGGEGSDALVSEVDMTPTLLELARARPCVEERCRTLDGRSLLPLLTGHGGSWPADRAVPLRLGDCRIRAIRTPTNLFTRYLVPEPSCHRDSFELFDLAEDPHQLEATSPRRAELAAWEERLYVAQRCSGIASRDPAPPGHVGYCE